jgi:hypothetical protein
MINIRDLSVYLPLPSNFKSAERLTKIIKGIYSVSTEDVTQKKAARNQIRRWF